MITAAKARERQSKFKAIGDTLDKIGEAIEDEIDSGSLHQHIMYHVGSEEKYMQNSALPVLSPENILLMKQLQANGYTVEYRWAGTPYTPAAYQDSQENIKYDNLEFLIGWNH